MDYVKAFGMIFVLVFKHINNDIFNVYYAYLSICHYFFLLVGFLYKDTRCITNFTAHVIKCYLIFIITYLIIGSIALLINVMLWNTHR